LRLSLWNRHQLVTGWSALLCLRIASDRREYTMALAALRRRCALFTTGTSGIGYPRSLGCGDGRCILRVRGNFQSSSATQGDTFAPSMPPPMPACCTRQGCRLPAGVRSPAYIARTMAGGRYSRWPMTLEHHRRSAGAFVLKPMRARHFDKSRDMYPQPRALRV